MQALLDSVKSLSTRERKALAILLKRQGVNLYAVAPIAPRDPDDLLVLSYAQQRQWFLWQLEPTSTAYNMPTALRLNGHLDVDALRASFESLIARHETLRTTFVQDGDQATQIIHPSISLPLSVESVHLAPGQTLDTALKGWVDAETRQPFDLEQGPLLRVKLLRLAEDDHVLVFTLHHVVSDGWSTPLLVDELVHLYTAHVDGQAPSLPALPIQYADYALWQRQWMEAGEQERQLSYWTAQLGGEQPVLALPADHAHPAMQDHAGASLDIVLPAELAQGLKHMAQDQGVTLFMVLLASFQTLLHRYSGQDDIRVGVPTANRNRVETERLIGFFVNTQVLKAEFELHLTVAELLQQVRQTVLDAQAHQDLPFEQLVEALQPERSLSHRPLFQVMYNHQTQVKGQRRQLPGLSVEGLAWERHTAQFDLTLDTFESQDGIGAALTYATALFEPETIARLAAHWRNVLQAIVRDPQQRIAELPMLDDADYQQIVHDWNRTDAAYPRKCLQQLVEAQVARTPDAVAVIVGEQPLTYRQLNERANRLAHHLRELGVGPDVLVGIALERSADLVVGLLAVLKAGGAYVPLDPEYPRERVAYMMQDSQALLLLSQSSLQHRLPGNGQAKVLLLDQLVLEDYPSDNLPCLTTPENLAYNIYTSGSTGQPKGVQIEHRNAAALIGWAAQVYSQQDLMGVLASTSVCFDLSVWEVFVTLSAGGYLVLADNALALGQLPARDQVHLVNTVPSAIKALLEAGQLPASVRVVNLAGEPLKQSLVDALYATGHIQRVYDLYGPSEDTTYSTWTLRTAGGQANIGRPIANSAVYLLGSASQPVPLGSAGELCLSGAGLARGYLGRAALTAEKFLPDPFDTSTQGGGRLYRTGDLARYRADGVIEYAGRIDHQVKIRGFRIELGEIAVRLLQHPALRDAVVIDTEGANGKQLVAYLVPAEGAEVDAQAIRSHLQATLPDYMVPAHLVTLDALPLTPNGKLDRKALPQPDLSQAQQAYVAPHTKVQAQLAAIWAQVLKVPQVGLNDNFFELGGDSIVSIQVVSRARQAGIHFTPKQLFQHQTVQGLAAVAQVGEQGGVQVDQGPVTGPALLLPIQQWFFEQAIPDRHHWNQSLLLTPGQRLDAQVLEQTLQALVAHHDGLRLGFVRQDQGQWRAQYGGAQQTSPLLWHAQCQDAQALQALCEQAQASLNLQQGPLLRAVLAQLADGSQRLLLVIHHLVVDGVSWRILLQDLQTVHGQLSAGQLAALPAKTTAGKRWAERVQDYALGEAQGELAFWRTQLDGAEHSLPCDNPQGSLQGRHATRVQTRLDQEVTRKLLQQAPTAYRTQINDLLLTALARVIGRWTQQQDVLVQLEGHGREDVYEDVDLTRTVGWFTSLYPVKLSAAASMAESIKQIKEQLRAIPNKGLGFGALRYLGDDETREALGQLPVPRITFNYLGQFDGSFAQGAPDDEGRALFTPAAESSGANQSAQSDLGNWLSINGQVYNGELNLGWTFSRDMFNPASVQRLADDLAQELNALVAHCVDEQAHGITPSDVPLANLSQAQLDSLDLPVALIEDLYPLSPMQQGMLFHALYDRQTGHYINQMRVDVQGLDVARFQRAWQQAVEHHDVLRANFVTAFEQPLQLIRSSVQMPLVELDCSAEPDLAQRLDAWAKADRDAGFDLHHDSLLRIAALRTGPDQHHLVYTSHHILMDGWSNSQLLGEVLQRYAGQAPAQPAGQYREHIQWLGRQDRQASETFWRQQLQAVDHPTRLADAVRNDPGEATAGQGDYYHVLDASRTHALNEFARQHRVTVNTVVQAAWLLLLQRYTGQDCVTFGATVSGRPADLEGVEQQLGLFINTLPVIACPRPELSVAAWLEQVQDLNLSLREHEHTPLYDIQRWAGAAAQGLFDTLLVFENYPVSEALQQGAPAGLVFSHVKNQEQTHYPLTLALGLGTTLSMHFSHARAHFSDAGVRQIAAHFDHLLNSLISDGRSPVGSLVLLDDADYQQIVHDWNRTEADYPRQCLQQLVEAQVARTPDAVAVIAGEQPLTYRQLNERANRLAHHLRELGVGPDVLVGIALERSADLVVGLLAVLKAGGAYVPLDPEYPRERVAYMMQDSQALLLLSQSSLQHRLPGNGQAKVLLLDQLVLEDYPSDNLPCLTTPENLAYNIYTSGSTGQPKGVQIEHRNAAALIGWAAQVYSQQDLMGVLASTSVCFDLSVWEVFVTLSAGGYLVLADNALALGQLPARDQVHLVNTVPSAIKALLEAGQLPASVRVVNLAGEPLKQSLVDALYATGHIQRVYDLYGPSEDTTYSTWTLRTAGGQANIGRPIANSAVYLLGSASQPVPLGSAGELCLSGAGLARGYLGRAALTAEKFLPDPFDTSTQGGGRLYRTGDLARYRADGVIEYAGRIDHQVKIRGFRIELGEIAVRLLQHPALRDAVVIDTEGANGKQLVAYLVPAEGAEVDAQAIRSHLQATLPDYMVPAHLVTLDALPLTPNGKLDRKALPAPGLSQSQTCYVAPHTELQQQLAHIWAEVLKVERVGLTDNFFELGGHSLLVISVVSRLQLTLGVEVGAAVLFQHPTLEDFAQQLDVENASAFAEKLQRLDMFFDDLEEGY